MTKKLYLMRYNDLMRAILLLAFLTIATCAKSQVSLKFCVEVKAGGYCQSNDVEFNVSDQGGTISFLLVATDSLNTNNVVYKLYNIQPDGTEIYLKDIKQPVNKSWTYAWQDVIFYDPGMYKVRAYDVDHDNTFLCSGLLKIFK